MTMLKTLLLGSTACFATANDQGSAPELSVTVTGEVPGYEIGQVVSGEAAVVQYLRDANSLGDDAIGELTDNEIAQIAYSVERTDDMKDDSDWEVAVFEAFANGPIEDDEEGAQPITDARLASVAAKIDADKDIERTMISAVDGQEAVDSGPAFIVERLRATLTIEELALIPVIGSKKENGGNGPWDVYETTKVNANGDRVAAKGSHIRDLIANHHVVAAKQAKIDEIKRAIPEGQKPTPADNAAIKKWSAQKSTATRQLTVALRAMQVADIIDGHMHVSWVFETVAANGLKKGAAGVVEMSDGSLEKVSRTKYPLVLLNRHKQTEFTKMTAKAFGNLKPGKDMRFAEVVKSARRAPRPPGSQKIEAKAVVPTFANLVNALETNGIEAVIRTEITKETGNAAFLTAARLRDLLTDLVDKADTPMVADKVTVKDGVKIRVPGKPSRLQRLRDEERAAGNAPEETANAA